MNRKYVTEITAIFIVTLFVITLLTCHW